MKKNLLLICAIFFASIGIAQEQFTIGELTYEVTGDSTVTVWKINETATYIVIPATVTYDGVVYNVTAIGKEQYAPQYGGRENLVSVVLPNSITSIGYEAFRNCKNLSSITIPNSVISVGERAFLNCESLTSVTLPANASISSDAFKATGGVSIDDVIYGGCDTLNIGNYIFYNTGFMTFHIGENTYNSNPNQISILSHPTSISGNLSIPSTIQMNGNTYPIAMIEGGAFYECKDLTSVTIPQSVVAIGSLNDYYGAFEECNALTSVVIPEGVKIIGDLAFFACNNLTTITLPTSINHIGYKAFAQCSLLNTVTMPEGINIHQNAFMETGGAVVDGVTYGGNDTLNIGNYSLYSTGFMNFVINGNTYSVNPTKLSLLACDTTKSGMITIPPVVTINGNTYPVSYVKGKSFYKCVHLTSVILPTSVTAIGNLSDWYGAFEECENLISITLPDSLKTIGNYTFYKCKNLLTIEIPNTVTRICDGAFAYCSNLSSVILPENASIHPKAFKETATIVEDEITYGGYDTLTIGNYTLYHTGFMTFYLGEDAINVLPTKVSIISCATSKNGDFVIEPIIEINGNNYPVVFIKGMAFYRCEDITSITVPEGVVAIGTLSDSYGAFERCSSLTSVQLPNSLTHLGNYTFWNCVNLTSVVVPDNVAYIGKGSFNHCDSLTSVSLGNGLISLYPKMFYASSALKDVVLGENLCFIGRGAFTSCNLLENVVSMANIPPFLQDNFVFLTPNNTTLTVPCGRLEDYSSENLLWTNYFEDRIEEDCSGIQDVEDLDVQITNNNRHINISSLENNLQIEVYNYLGQKVFATKNYQFTLNNVSAGMYIIKAFNNTKTKTAKIVVK